MIVFLFVTKQSFSQVYELGSPMIQNILPKEYGYESQNYSIVQDDRGLLYIGNVSGILEYDGNDWRLININGIPRLTYANDKKVYVSGYDDFGYLDSDDKNNTVFVSLIEKLPKQERHIGEVNGIFSIQDAVIFYTNSKIYKWHSDYLTVIDSSETDFDVFKVDNRVYVSKKDIGILNYVYNGFDTLPNASFFKNKTIKQILPYKNGNLLIKTARGVGFYIYDFKSVKTFHTQVDNYLQKNKLNTAIWISSGHYIFGTERCGFAIINEEGELVVNINRENGLKDDQINDIYADNYNNLWLALSNGLSKIEFPSAFTYFGKNSGIRGGISSVIKHKKVLYVATTQGVFFLKKYSVLNEQLSCVVLEKFEPVDEILTDCNILFEINNNLYVTSTSGIYRINDDIGELIYSGDVESVLRSRIDTNIIYISTSKGLVIAKFEKDKLVDFGKLRKLDKPIRTMVEETSGELWMGSNFHGVFMVDFSKGIDFDADVLNFKENLGLPKEHEWIDVYSTNKKVLFSTQKGAFRFNNDSLRFYTDTLLGIDFSKHDNWVFPVVEDAYKNLWLSSGSQGKFLKTTAFAKYNKNNEKYQLNPSIFNNISEFTIEAIYPDDNGIIWFGSFDGLIRYDRQLDYRQSVNYKTFIRRIIIGVDSVLYNGANNSYINDTNHIEFKYKFNDFHFDFSAPNFISSSALQYKHFLEGFDSDWSEWDDLTSINYTNLSEGVYTFRVKAKDLYNNISEEAVFHFHINPPIYRTWYAFIVYILFVTVFIIMIVRWREYLFAQEKLKLEKTIAEKTEEIVIQKERAEQLVANILPPDTARELQNKGKATRKVYKMATVLFSDIQGFTKIAEHMNPEKLLDELDRFFFDFDNVIGSLNIEKIKTIGDAYMCAGGIPMKNKTNPIDVVVAGMIMQQHMKKLREESENEWDIRIGIHTGPVIAGVVGSKKLSYDIWGDTVNVASRMESSGEIGEINISETTYELVKNFFVCEPRGKIPVKYKGDISMYFVKGIKPELSIDSKGLLPNREFNRMLQYIRFDDLEELIMHKLEKGLPPNLYYHNLKHTIDVIIEVEIIGRNEGVSKEDLLLLKTAALFHDTGFIVGYEDHELLGIKFAKDILADFFYTEEQINIICDLIYSTHPTVTPKTHLEKIICDADLDYLGREDYLPISQNLFRELYEKNRVKSLEEWHKRQIKFMETHEYYTETARIMRNDNKMKHLEELKQMI